jgi:hypothetical protein
MIETIESLKKHLKDKDELEANFDECMEELGRIQGEDEVSLRLTLTLPY